MGLLPLRGRNDLNSLSPNLLHILPQNLHILKLPHGRRLPHESPQQRLLLQQRSQRVSQLRIRVNRSFVKRRCGGRGCGGSQVRFAR